VPDHLVRDVFDEDDGEAFAIALELEFRLTLVRRASADLSRLSTIPYHGGQPGGLEDWVASRWLAIFGLVLAAASISKLLWPRDDPTRGAARLRHAIGPGTVLSDRRVRNSIEHADETFHQALFSERDGPPPWELTTGHDLDPEEEFVLNSVSQGFPMRRFNVTTWDLTVLGRGGPITLNLRELAVAADVLSSRLADERKRHSDGMASGDHHWKFFQ
jgi:hypothetical protein